MSKPIFDPAGDLIDSRPRSKTPLTDAAMIAVDFVRGAPVPYVTADFARKLETDMAELVDMVRRLSKPASKAGFGHECPTLGTVSEARALLARLEAE